VRLRDRDRERRESERGWDIEGEIESEGVRERELGARRNAADRSREEIRRTRDPETWFSPDKQKILQQPTAYNSRLPVLDFLWILLSRLTASVDFCRISSLISFSLFPCFLHILLHDSWDVLPLMSLYIVHSCNWRI
jgi:hypothetical protein